MLNRWWFNVAINSENTQQANQTMGGREQAPASLPSYGRRLAEVIWAFLPLGWIAFGGPQAHIALLQERFVERRRWLDERRFVELLGLGQGLPGPTSTQMVVAVGAVRAGPVGGLLAFLCF
ncbi:MAG: chromate transporter, partial [Dehalococcoidia bacterium]